MRQIIACVTTLGLLGFAAWAAQEPQQTKPPQASKAQPHGLLGAVFPRISSDGESLAFSYQGAIWTIPRSGGTMTRLTTESGFDIEPTWSPNGSKIAYVNSSTFGPGELRIIDSNTGRPIPLSQRVEVLGTNVYQKLEFQSETRVLGVFRVAGQPFGLGWIDLQSGESKVILNVPRWGRYALSNDRKSIAYTSTLDVSGQQNGNDGRQNGIHRVSVNGGPSEEITQFPSRIYDLCWDAAGTGLFVVSDFGGAHNDLWHVTLSDPERGLKKVTSGQADEDRPSVSSDGKWLVYTDNRRSATSLVVRHQPLGTDQEVLVDRVEFRTPPGQLRLTTRDKQTQKEIVTRVSIQQIGGKPAFPAASLYRTLGSVPHYYHTNQPETVPWELPAGNYLIRVFRGPEYVAYRGQFEVQGGEVKQLTIDLERWTDSAARGWYSGENHIHANYGYGQWYNGPQTMLEQCSGEDLHVCNFMVANSDTDAVFDREYFRGRLDPVSTAETLLYWNQEFRSTIWGHMTLINLKQVVEPVFTGFKDTTNPWDIPTNSEIADRTHWQKGLVNYTHVAQNPDDPYENPYTGKGIPIDVALGKIDTLDLNASYAGTLPLWYRLLNCGFRLPASAGTDTFLNRIASRLPGGDRVYVKLAGPLTYENWIEGLRSGRSFVSNGPMLDLAVENSIPGDTLKLDTGRAIRVKATAASQFPMSKVELIYNGQVVATAKLNEDKKSATLDQEVRLDQSGWIAFRASGPGHPDHPVGSLDAHTSPVYVVVANKPAGSKVDAEYFLKWIDRLSLAIRIRDRIPDAKLREQVQEHFHAARAVYLKILEQ